MLSGALALLGACGGAQPTTGLWQLGASVTEPGQPEELIDLIPADSRYVMLARMGEQDSFTLMNALFGNPLYKELGERLQTLIDVPLRSAQGYSALGFAPGGELALFTTQVAPVAIIELGNPELFQSIMLRLQEEHPDIDWDKRRIGGANFLHGTTERGRFDLAAVNRYAVLRYSLPEESLNVGDVALSSIMLGNLGTGFRHSPQFQELMEGRSAPPDQLVVASTRFFYNLMREITRQLPQEGDANLFGADMGTSCEQAVDTLLEAAPWFQQTTEHQGTTTRSRLALSLSDAAHERLRPIFTGVLQGLESEIEETELWLSFNLNLPALGALLQEASRFEGCAPMDQLHAAGVMLEPGNPANPLLPGVDGRIAVALYDLNLGGVLPVSRMILSLGSLQSLETAEAIQALVESRGIRGSVDETAPHTTIRYRFFGVVGRLIQVPDRVIAGVGNVPRDMVNALATAEAGGADAPFGQLRISGALLTTTWGIIDQFLGTLAELAPEANLDATLEQFRAQTLGIQLSTGEYRLTPRAIVVDSLTERSE